MTASTPDFGGLFGMCEMESAARHIVEVSLESKSWNCSWTMASFEGRNSFESDGFLCLLSNGFLVNRPGSAAHGEFVPTREFIDRVRPRLRGIRLPKVPEWLP
jgi:hypothetical protein